MAILAFLLGAALFLAGLGSLWASLNLLPTEMGQLYGVSGVVLIGCAAIVVAIAALIVRIGQLGAYRAEPLAPSAPPPAAEREAPPPDLGRFEPQTDAGSPFETNVAPAPDVAAPVAFDAEEPDRAPPLKAPEESVDRGKRAPQVIGRYAAGGANYVIFSDGTIEAETEEGPIRFASMADFRSYIARRMR